MTTDLSHPLEQPVPKAPRNPVLRRLRLSSPLRLRNFSEILGLFLVAVTVFVALSADFLAPVDPWRSVGTPFQPPRPEHLFGTDDLGRDLFSGVVHGARTSLIVGLAVALFSATIGILLGALSGYFGGLLDDALMRFTEFFQVLPRFFLALVAISLFTPGLLTITLVLALTSWSTTTRLLRAQVLSVREREFVLATRALGGGSLHILLRHILPNTLTPIIVHTTLMIGQVMLLETSLAFLGLGDPTHISWGYLLNNAQSFLRTAWWMPLFPGLALTLAVLGFNFAGDAIHHRMIK